MSAIWVDGSEKDSLVHDCKRQTCLAQMNSLEPVSNVTDHVLHLISSMNIKSFAHALQLFSQD